MTDESMDARLRAAGEHWREATDATVGVDVESTVAAEEILPAPVRRPKRRGVFASAAVIAAALVVGGTALLHDTSSPSPRQEAGETAGLVGTVWELLGYDDQTRPSSTSTFYIGSDGALVADDSCGVVGGSAKIDGQQLAVTDLVVRYRSCVDTSGEMVFAPTGTKVLDGTSTYVVDGDSLTITGDGTTMHFAALPPATLPPTLDVPTFVGAHWKLVKIGDSTDVPADTPFFVADDGALTASDGCNTLNGTVADDGGGRVTFENVGGTEIGCDTVQSVRAVLSGRVQEHVLGSRLTLSKDGSGSLTYAWVPNDKTATDPKAVFFKSWTLLSIAGGQPLHSDFLYVSSSGEYSAANGCGTVGGKVEVGQGTIAFSGVPSSGPNCGGSAGDEAATVDSYLSNAHLFSVRDGKLIISGEDAQEAALVYTTDASPAPSPSPSGNSTNELVAHDWYVTSFEHEGADSGSSTSAVSTLQLTFDGRGGFIVIRRCGEDGGSVSITSFKMDFSKLHNVQEHSCPEGPHQTVTDTETNTLEGLLDGSVAWTLANDELRITDGPTTVVFGPAPPDEPIGVPSDVPSGGPTGAPSSPDPSPTDVPTELPGSQWTLNGIEHTSSDGSGSGSGSSEYASIVLKFGKSGDFTVTGLCGTVSGTANVVDADTVTFENVSPFSSSCPGPEEAVNAVRAVLTPATTWSISDGQLTLTKGDTSVSFDPA